MAKIEGSPSGEKIVISHKERTALATVISMLATVADYSKKVCDQAAEAVKDLRELEKSFEPPKERPAKKEPANFNEPR